jgi:hypothetical protein
MYKTHPYHDVENYDFFLVIVTHQIGLILSSICSLRIAGRLFLQSEICKVADVITHFILLQEFDVLMESKGGKKSSSSRSMMYEAPLGYSIEDVRPAGGVKKYQSAAYSNVRISHYSGTRTLFVSDVLLIMLIVSFAVRQEAILISPSAFPSRSLGSFFRFDSDHSLWPAAS